MCCNTYTYYYCFTSKAGNEPVSFNIECMKYNVCLYIEMLCRMEMNKQVTTNSMAASHK